MVRIVIDLFSICELIHFLSYFLFYHFEFGLWDKLGERIDLLLIKQCNEVIAESSHFTITLKQHFFYIPIFTYFL